MQKQHQHCNSDQGHGFGMHVTIMYSIRFVDSHNFMVLERPFLTLEISAEYWLKLSNEHAQVRRMRSKIFVLNFAINMKTA